jgi:hypothetical protein
VRARALAEHNRLASALDDVAAALVVNDGPSVARLWSELQSGLFSQLEEQDAWLVPKLLRVHERGARVLIHEHRHLRARLADLDIAVRSHRATLDALRNFKSELRAHARTESRILCEAEPCLDRLCVAGPADAPTGKRPV